MYNEKGFQWASGGGSVSGAMQNIDECNTLVLHPALILLLERKYVEKETICVFKKRATKMVWVLENIFYSKKLKNPPCI